MHSGIVRFLSRKPRAQEFWALRNISFDVEAGRVLGIIGPNGSGKSTMLRVFSRILAPDEGELEIRGQVSSLLSLGAGFQLELTGLENVYYNGILLGLTRQQIQERKESIIEFADLGSFIDAPVRTYSTGMRARLGFSVAVHVDPEILVVDEVLVVGDASFRERCAAKILELFSQGTTVIMVQHNLEAVLQMCHECLWLEHGAVKMMGTPPDVIRAYLESQGLPMIPAPTDGMSALSSEVLPGTLRERG